MKKYFITGGQTFFENRGVEAIIKSTVFFIQKNNKKSIFYIPTNNLNLSINRWKDYKKYGVVFLKNKNNFFTKFFFKLFLIKPFFFIKIFKFNPKHKLFIDKSDFVISVGGDNYSMNYNLPIDQIFQDLYAVKKKFCILWSASLDNMFCKYKYLNDLKFFLSKFNYIYLREKKSFNILKKLNLKNIFYIPEIALSLPIIKKQKLFKNKNITVGLNWFKHVSEYRLNSNHEKSIINFIKVLLKQNYNVLIIYHTSKKNSLKLDEYSYLKYVTKNLIKENKNIKILPPNLNALEIKSYISQLDYFFTLRYHAYIAAISSNVPAIIFSYSLKSYSNVKDIFNNLNTSLPFLNINQENLIKKFSYLKKNKIKIKQDLKKFNSFYKKSIKKLYPIIN